MENMVLTLWKDTAGMMPSCQLSLFYGTVCHHHVCTIYYRTSLDLIMVYLMELNLKRAQIHGYSHMIASYATMRAHLY